MTSMFMNIWSFYQNERLGVRLIKIGKKMTVIGMWLIRLQGQENMGSYNRCIEMVDKMIVLRKWLTE